MTNQDVYNSGRITGTFNYINPYDPDNTYVGLLVKLDDNIYEVIVNQHSLLIDPDGQAVVIRTDTNETGGFTQTFNYSETLDKNDNTFDQNIDLSKIQEELGFDIKDYVGNQDIPAINQKFIDFNSPW